MATIKHVSNGEIRIISIEDARLVDGPAIEQCYREIVEVLEKTEESCVALHFGRVKFMSSSALGMLVRVNKKCKEFKIDLKLCNIAPEICKVFKLTGMDKLFAIHDDVSQALEAFKKSGKLTFRKQAPTSYEVREDR